MIGDSEEKWRCFIVTAYKEHSAMNPNPFPKISNGKLAEDNPEQLRNRRGGTSSGIKGKSSDTMFLLSVI